MDHLGDHVAEHLARVRGFETNVRIDGRGHALMPEQKAYHFIFARPMFQDDRCCGMAKLVNSDPQTQLFLNSLGDLTAERNLALGTVSLPGEQPTSLRPLSRIGRKSRMYSSRISVTKPRSGYLRSMRFLRHAGSGADSGPSGFTRFRSSLMLVRLASRTGAVIRIAMAAASWAVTAARIGERSFCRRASAIIARGRLTTFAQTSGLKTLRMRAMFLSVNPALCTLRACGGDRQAHGNRRH